MMITISFGGTSEVVDAMVFLGRMDWDWEAASSPPSEVRRLARLARQVPQSTRSTWRFHYGIGADQDSLPKVKHHISLRMKKPESVERSLGILGRLPTGFRLKPRLTE